MTSWMKDAPCFGQSHLFFEEKRPTVVRQAREICGSCSLVDTCLEYAISNKEVGIWAGLTTNQRAKLVRSRRKNKKDLRKIV